MTRSLLLTATLAALTILSACTKDVTCPVGELFCAGQCVDPAVDAANCGGCGATCDGGTICKSSACACPSGQDLCGSTCVNLATSPAHCGACGNACATGYVCGTSGGATACVLDCPSGTTPCGAACVTLDSDRLNCGACDRPCVTGESCLSGSCSSLQVACFSVNEVRAVEPLDLASGAAPRPAGVGPVALTTLGADVWAAASLSGSLVRLPVLATAPVEYLLGGNDFEYITAHAGLLLISNAGAGTVVIADPVSGGVAGEITVGASASDNIKGIAFAAAPGGGEEAYVSLQGSALPSDPVPGQRIAVLDAAGLPTCGVAGSPLPCLGTPSYLDVSAGAGPDAGALPFPGRSIAHGGKVYVVLANLKLGSYGYFTDPAGPGRLAVVDPADLSVSYVSLTVACGNPGGIALHGSSLWVACAAYGASGLAEVDLSGSTPVLVAVHPAAVTSPGNVAFCGDHGFVTDQWSGDVYPFDPVDFAASPAAATAICPASAGAYGYAWAADVTCASRP